MTIRDDLAFVRDAYLHDITWANPAQAERDFDDLIRKIRAEAWNEGFDTGERDVFDHEAHKDGFDSPCVSNPYGEVAP